MRGGGKVMRFEVFTGGNENGSREKEKGGVDDIKTVSEGKMGIEIREK